MSNLTPAQLRAVTSESREILVVAGAGSGKTKTLVARIAHLLRDRGVSGSQLLCLTFTRKAAGELIARLEIELGEAAPRELRYALIGTFHSVALRILRADGDKLGWDPPRMTVLDPEDAELLLRQAAAGLGYQRDGKWGKGLSEKRLSEYLEGFYTGARPKWLDEQDVDETAYELIVRDYHTTARSMNVLDFGMILKEVQRLFTLHPEVLAGYRQRIAHCLVDELQDTDETQFNLHDFFSPPAAFFGVGDIRQTIYDFRGARPELMFARHPQAELINLNECFRCGAKILDSANRLIAVNAEPHCEPLTPGRGHQGAAESFAGRSAAVVAEVKTMHEMDQFAWGDIAVLARNHRTLRRLEECFQEATVPCYRVGAKFGVCETPEFRMVHSALRLLANPRDDMAFLRLSTTWGVIPFLPTIRARASAEHSSLWNVYAKLDIPPTWITNWLAYQAQEMRGLSQALERVIEATPFSTGRSAALDFWMADSGWLTVSLEEALKQFAARDSQDDIPLGDHVTLLTVHAAKGLEWPAVVVCGLNEGDFPSSQAIRGDGVREERRLCYVAMTRAKERLSVHYRRPEDQAEDRTVKQLSRFLQEAGL